MGAFLLRVNSERTRQPIALNVLNYLDIEVWTASRLRMLRLSCEYLYESCRVFLVCVVAWWYRYKMDRLTAKKSSPASDGTFQGLIHHT